MSDKWVRVTMHVTIEVAPGQWDADDDVADDIYSYFANHITFAPSIAELVDCGAAKVTIE